MMVNYDRKTFIVQATGYLMFGKDGKGKGWDVLFYYNGSAALTIWHCQHFLRVGRMLRWMEGSLARVNGVEG